MPPSPSSPKPARDAASPERNRPAEPGARSGHPGHRLDRRERRRVADSRRIPHAVTFQHDPNSCSQLLFGLMQAVPPEGMSLRTLIHSLGERGLLMTCIVLCLPSMVPVPLPGLSVPQGFLIGLLGLGLLLNRAPMLPERILNYRLGRRNLHLILEKGTRLFARIEKLSHPRLDVLTRGLVIRAVNGTLLVVGAALLMAPFPIPFSNVLPAYAILFLAFGIMQRDGWLVMAAYAALVVSILYIAAVLHFGMAVLMALFR
jgi:hypothetical protein